MPNLAAVLAAVTLLYCLFVYGGPQLFRDSDAGWHIRTGEWILEHRSLPPADLYSFSRPGNPWFAWEWGSDVLLGAVHRRAGLKGVAALMAVVVGLCSWLWCSLSFSVGGDFFLTALLAAPMVTTASLHWLARPHVFSWIFLLALLLYLESGRRRPLDLVFLTAFAALWANMHASFFLAPLIAAIYAIAHISERFIWEPSSSRVREGTGTSSARWFLKIALTTLAGSFLNPYGWHLHQHVLAYLQDNELTSRIAEFQSFNFHDKDAAQVVIVMAVAALGAVASLSQKRLAHFLLSAIFLIGALRSARMIPMVALLILPLANGAIRACMETATGLRTALRRKIDAVLKESTGLIRIDRQLSGAVFTALAVALALIALRAPAQAVGFPQDRFPVAAADAVAKLPADARILSSDSFGGYLIYRFNGQRKVYFDGRSDFYGADFMKQYMVLVTGRPGWQAIVKDFGFTHALLPNDSALKSNLMAAGWAVLYKDSVATLLARPEETH